MVDYWLYSWIDEQGVRSRSDADDRLSEPEGMAKLLRSASEAVAKPDARFTGVDGEYPIVAGAHLDLSSTVTCAAAACQIAQVDELFSRVWHYFDRIVVEGLAPDRLPDANEPLSDEHRRWLKSTVLRHVQVLLHLKAIGADSYLEFRTKPHAFCADHYRQHAGELDIPALLDDSVQSRVIDRILQGAELDDLGDGSYAFKSPALDLIRVIHRISDGESTDEYPPSLRELAERAFTEHSVAAVGDIALARSLQLPLALTVDDILLPGPGSSVVVTEDEVALELQLPYLTGLTTRDLIQIREDYHTEFDQLRHAITLAIRAAVSATGSAQPKAIAQRVERESVTPAVADIERRLQSARRLLTGKLLQDLPIAAIATAVGLMSGVPLIVGAGIAAGAKGLAHANRYLEEKRDIELSDMYFLWRARSKHSTH